MKVIIALLLSFSLQAMAVSFDCTLSARDNLMEKFETKTQTFDPTKFGMELESKGFLLKVRSTLVEGKDHLALILKKGSPTAATAGPEEQANFFLNLHVDPAFAVAECKRK